MSAGETLVENPEALFLEKIEAHAQAVLERSRFNTRYVEQVRTRKEQVAELFSGKIGVVDSVVSTWIDDFRPIAQELFGASAVAEEALLLPIRFSDYSQTLLPGISARIRRISLDEIMGPMLSLDVSTAQSSL